MTTLLRPPVPADATAIGAILFEAFRDIAERHGFPPDFPNPEATAAFVSLLYSNPSIGGVVAEQDGRVVGSNFLWQEDPIRGVGPITVDLQAQGQGVGRRLMEAVLEWVDGAPGVRLVQDSFNTRSLALYASLGFEVKEPLMMIEGRPKSAPAALPGRTVRPFEPGDLDACNELCRRVHGFNRASELRNAQPPVEPWVTIRDGRLTAYVTSVQFWPLAHGVAETEEDMWALMLEVAAARSGPLSFLLPIRQAAFFRWCLSEGLRCTKPMNLMAIGAYQEPRGCWFPTVLY